MSPEALILEMEHERLVEMRSEYFSDNGMYGSDAEVIAYCISKYHTQEDTTATNNGGATSYYDLPPNSTTLQDLMEYKDMTWNQANIFKAAYRLRDETHSSMERDLNKIIWFANRMLDQLKRDK